MYPVYQQKAGKESFACQSGFASLGTGHFIDFVASPIAPIPTGGSDPAPL